MEFEVKCNWIDLQRVHPGALVDTQALAHHLLTLATHWMILLILHFLILKALPLKSLFVIHMVYISINT